MCDIYQKLGNITRVPENFSLVKNNTSNSLCVINKIKGVFCEINPSKLSTAWKIDFKSPYVHKLDKVSGVNGICSDSSKNYSNLCQSDRSRFIGI